jgi:hypothetical protein
VGSFNNDGPGIDLFQCTSCVVHRAVSALNADHGVTATAFGATFHQVSSTENAGSGFYLGADNVSYFDTQASGNQNYGYEDVDGVGVVFTGEYAAWGNGEWDDGSGGDFTCTNIVRRTCANGCPEYGLNDAGECCNECYLQSAHDPLPVDPRGILENVDKMLCVLDTRVSTAALTPLDEATGLGFYVGGAADTANPEGQYAWNGPVGSAPYDAVTDRFTYEAWHRGWGNMGCHAFDCSVLGSAPDEAVACTDQDLDYAGVNQGALIRDFRVSDAKDQAWRMRGLPTGASTTTHAWSNSTATADCASLLPGSVAGASTCESTFANRASEVVGDMQGNENYLCESGEVCIWAPYPTAWQGEGPLIAVPNDTVDGGPTNYTFPDGDVTDVTLLQHETLAIELP